MTYLLWACLLYGLYLLVLFLLQRRIIYPRNYIVTPPVSDNTNESRDANHETHWIETRFGKIESWLLKPEKNEHAGPIPVMIFAHGNAELIDYCREEFFPMTKWGLGILMIEYPGYGRSQGSPSQKTILEAFLGAYDWLVSRKDVDPDRIALCGRSLGGGAACCLAARRPSAAMILMSTYTSVRSFARGFLAPGFLILDPFDNLSVVKRYRAPVLIVHGKHDDIIPYKHARTLNRFAENSSLITYDCAHNDCPPDYPVYLEDIRGFLIHSGIL